VAFPQVSDADTQSGTVTSDTDPWALTYPTNLANGDLILAFIATDGGVAPSWPAGWFSNSTGSTTTLGWAKKKSDGTETGSFNVTLSQAEQGGWRVFRITNWEGTIGTGIINNSAGASVVSLATSGTSTTPNPPALNPNNWGSEDTLWFAAAGAAASATFSAFPGSYTNTSSDVAGGASAASLGIARRELNTASEDPGTFTVSSTVVWQAVAIGIRPIPSTNAPAESAAATGIAANASPTATGSTFQSDFVQLDAFQTAVELNAPAGNAAATGAAYVLSMATAASIGAGSGTGTAYAPTAGSLTPAAAGLASGTGAAQVAATLVVGSAGAGTATGTAYTPMVNAIAGTPHRVIAGHSLRATKTF
jgi:hypothetical protein